MKNSRARASRRDAPRRKSCPRSRRRCTAYHRRPSRSLCAISAQEYDSEEKADTIKRVQ